MKAKVAEMRAAKGGKGKGKAKRVAKVSAKAVREKNAVSSGRVDKSSSGGQQEKHYCNAKNCWNEVSWSKNDGKNFVKCYPCKKRGTKRSQHAMSAAVGATGGSEEFVQRIRDLSAKQKSLQSADGSIRAQAFDLIAKDLSPNARDDTIEERLMACQLILEFGKVLNDKALRKKTSELRAGSGKGNGKGKKGGKGSGKGGKGKDANSSGRQDKSSSRGQHEKHQCNAKVCWNEASWSSKDKR